MSNKNYIQGLLNYIVDIKPYHSKITEVIEEYTFFDNLLVSTSDKIFTKIDQSSIWGKLYTTDGYQRRFILPPFTSPRYSTEVNQYSLNLEDQHPYCLNVLNIPNAFQIRESRGVESVKVGNSSLAEGTDYHLSHGAFSIKVLENSKWSQTNLTDIINTGSIISASVKNGFTLSDFNVIFNKQHPDSWTITCTDISHIEVFNMITPKYMQTGEPTSPAYNDYWLDMSTDILYQWAGTWNIVPILPQTRINYSGTNTWQLAHNFNSDNLMWEIYEDSPTGTSIFMSADIVIVDKNNIEVNFVTPISGKIRIVNVPLNKMFVVPIVNSSNSWVIQHNLNTSEIITQVYIDQPGKGMVPVLPKNLIILDNNTIQIDFSKATYGKVLIVPSVNAFTQSTNKKKWVVNIADIGALQIIQAFALISGTIRQIIPNSIDIISNNTVEITFSKPISGFITSTPNIHGYRFSVYSKNIGFLGSIQDNEPFSGNDINFTVVPDANTIVGSVTEIKPQMSGFSISPTASVDEIWSIIKINPITCRPTQILRTGLAQVIAKSKWTTIVATTTQSDLYCIYNPALLEIYQNEIKLNPSDYTATSGTDIILHVIVSIGDIFEIKSFIPQEWTLHCQSISDTTATFTAYGSVSGDTFVNYVVNQNATSQFNILNQVDITCIPGIRHIGVGDSFNFFLGYDGGELDEVGFDGFENSFIPQEWTLTCNSIITDSNIPPNYIANFSAINLVTGDSFDNTETLHHQSDPGVIPIVTGDVFNFFLGYDGVTLNGIKLDNSELEDNAEIGIFELESIEDLVSYNMIKDISTRAARANVTTHILSQLPSPKFLPYTASFIRAPSETWTFTFQGGTNDFTVNGSTSGNQKNARIGEEYDNGIIRLRIISSLEPIDVLRIYENGYIDDYMSRMVSRGELIDGDKITLLVFDKKPNYLVHGSLSGFTEPAIVGEYYWNGKIGFNLTAPTYKITDQVSTQELTSGTITLNDGTQLTFNTPPRFDSLDERLNLTYHEAAWTQSKLTIPTQQFLINSNTRGQLPAAVLGVQYKDLESVDNYPNVCSNVNFTIDSLSNNISNFIINVNSNEYKPFYLQQIIILSAPITEPVKINTFQEDKFIFKMTSYYPELGLRSNISAQPELQLYGAIPTYLLAAVNNREYTTGYELDILDATGFDTVNASLKITPKLQYPAIPDRGDKFNLFLSNVKDTHIGTISWQFDTSAQFYRQVIDIEDDFASNYLTLNTNLGFEVQQADEYNQLVGTLITDHLSVLERIKFNDLLNVSMIENFQIVIKKYAVDTVNANIIFGDKGIGYDSIGYDYFPYDNYGANNVYKIDIKDDNHSADQQNIPSNNNFITTAINDFGLSAIISHPMGDAGYEEIGYDIGGYELLLDTVDVFKQLEPIKPGPYYSAPYTLIAIERSVSIITIELPAYDLTISISTDLNNLAGTQLLEGLDYSKILLSAPFGVNFPVAPIDLETFYLYSPVINYPIGTYQFQSLLGDWILQSDNKINPTYQIELINVQPVIVFAF